MRKLVVLLCLNLLLPVPASFAARVAPGSRTIFHHAESAWAVGTMKLGNSMPFRDGNILVFPSQISDLLWAPDATKPRNLMLVYEVASDEKDKPVFQKGDEIFAPIRLLPDHSYWKDNLPNTRRHEIAGGRRYVFRGDQIAEARKTLGEYLAATQLKGMERWAGEVNAVAVALGSPVQVLREDAVKFFAVYPTLDRDFKDQALPPVVAYLKSDAPVADKASLIHSLTTAKVAAVKPVLEELAARDDAVAAAALRGLTKLGETVALDRLLRLSQSPSVEVKEYAAEALGMRAGQDEAAFERARTLLDAGNEPTPVREAAARGLGISKSTKAVPALAAAVERGDPASRVAGEALAETNSPEAAGLLSDILKKTEGEAAISAVAALGRVRSCPQCATLLHEQHEAHRDPVVRNLIGVMLEVPLEHKH